MSLAVGLLVVDMVALAPLAGLALQNPTSAATRGCIWVAATLGLALAVAVPVLARLERRRTHADADAAQADRQRQREAMDAMQSAVVLWDADDRLISANRDFLQVYAPIAHCMQPGVRFEDAMRATVAAGMVPEAQADIESWLQRRLALRRQPAGPMLREMPDGRWRRIVEQRLSDGSLLAHSVDVTELVQTRSALQQAQRDAEQAQQRLADAVDVLPAGFELYDAEDRLVLVNQVARDMYPQLAELPAQRPRFEDVVRSNHALGGLPDLQSAAELEAWIARRQAERRQPGGSHLQRLAGDRWVRVHEQRTREGGLVGVRVDITEVVQREQALTALNKRLDELNAELSRLSETDALTGLANRRQFDRRLADECARAARHGTPLALLMVDVDHFKRYNDRHGHPSGDACLRRVAEALQGSARRPAELVARIGGEEFALLLPHHSHDEARTQAERCAAALLAAALPHGDSPVSDFVTVSIGGAQVAAPDAGFTAAVLLHEADAALYQAKQDGRSRIVMR